MMHCVNYEVIYQIITQSPKPLNLQTLLFYHYPGQDRQGLYLNQVGLGNKTS